MVSKNQKIQFGWRAQSSEHVSNFNGANILASKMLIHRFSSEIYCLYRLTLSLITTRLPINGCLKVFFPKSFYSNIHQHTHTNPSNECSWYETSFSVIFFGCEKNAPSAPFYTGAFIDRFFGDCHKVSNQLKYSRSFSMFRSVEFNSRTRKGVSYHFFSRIFTAD